MKTGGEKGKKKDELFHTEEGEMRLTVMEEGKKRENPGHRGDKKQ